MGAPVAQAGLVEAGLEAVIFSSAGIVSLLPHACLGTIIFERLEEGKKRRKEGVLTGCSGAKL